MKKLLPFLLLPSIVMAQEAPQKQMPAPPSFDQFKQTLLPVIEKSLPTMKETRECVSQADSKEAVEKCMNAMAQKAQQIQKEFGGKAKAVTSNVPEGFEWNPETKKMMLSNMDRSIKQNTAMHYCLGKSTTREEMGGCIQAKLPAPRRMPSDTPAPKISPE